MTIIDVDTSPLQAAREWRGISLIAAARSCGLTVAQAESLEAGDPSTFDTIDEMLAAAVVYGASIGIGRDEAVALMDRTSTGVGARAEVPDPPAVVDADDPAPAARPSGEFSQAVRERSARIEPSMLESVLAVDSHPVLDPIGDEEMLELEALAAGPSPQQAIDASAEIALDAFRPDVAWGQVDQTGELEAWAAEESGSSSFDAGQGGGVLGPQSRSSIAASPGVGARIGSTFLAALERIIGTERTDRFADWSARSRDRMGERLRSWRESLRRSEHATLILAIGGGAVLIALVVAIGGALGGSEEPAGPGPVDRSAASTAATGGAGGGSVAAAGSAATTAPTAPAAKAPVPVTPPARITVDVYNAGSIKGRAAQVGGAVKAAGYRVGEVTNSRGSYTSAVIIHPKGKVREARALARAAGITSLQEAPGTSSRFTIVVR